jgi:rod shape determining protein RodA
MAYGRIHRNKLKVDWLTVGLYAFLVLWGWLSIYAAVFDENSSSLFDLTQGYGKQGLWIAGSVLIIAAVFLSNFKLWTNLVRAERGIASAGVVYW